MPNLNFDVAGAKQAGYTDTQIADALAARANFDAAGARQAGFKDSDIVARLTTTGVKPVAAPTPAPEVDDPGVIGSAVIGAGRTFDRIGKGMKQLYYGATGNDQAQAKLAQDAAEEDKIYSKLQEQHPVATGIGEAVPSMVVPLGSTGTALGTALKLATAGAVPAALEYGSATDRGARALAGGAGAVVGGQVIPKVTQVIGNTLVSSLKGLAGKVTPEALALAAKAEAAGIHVNAAQLGDSKFLKTLSSSLEQMPFTGAAKTSSDQRAAFTRAVSKTFGEDADKITPEVYAAARTRLGGQFDDLAMRNTMNVDKTLLNRLDATLEEARQFGDDSTIRAVNNAYDRLIKQTNAGADVTAGKVGRNTVIELPGAAYSSLDRELGNIIKNGGEKGNYLKQMQLAIRDAMDRSIAPEDQAAWTAARTQYKNLKAVRNVVARDGGDGNIPPAQLMNALNNTEAGKEAMAMGSRGTLGELGRIGKQFVKDSVPNSGTAQRAIAMGLIGGGGFAFGASPAEVAGMLAGGATAGKLVNRILTSPKVIASLSEKGLTVRDLLKLPPDKITQIMGGISGVESAQSMRD